MVHPEDKVQVQIKLTLTNLISLVSVHVPHFLSKEARRKSHNVERKAAHFVNGGQHAGTAVGSENEWMNVNGCQVRYWYQSDTSLIPEHKTKLELYLYLKSLLETFW